MKEQILNFHISLKNQLSILLKVLLLVAFSQLFINSSKGQVLIGGDSISLDYSNPTEYEVGGITVSNILYLDENALKTLFGIKPGDKIKIPGDDISKGINNLWKQGILSNIKVRITSVRGNLVFLDLDLQERPRLSVYKFSKNVTKGEAEKLREKLSLSGGRVITENVIKTTEYITRQFYIDKGYFNAQVNVILKTDSGHKNTQTMIISLDKNNRTKINAINITGNSVLTAGKIKHKLKDTKEKHWYSIFKASKFVEENFVKDKESVLEKYQEMGYRDARIISDSVYKFDDNTINIDIHISEGNKYCFRNIEWTGNTKHSSKELNSILNINKGDIYNKKKLDQYLYMNQSGRDVSSLYLDDGYLFFRIDPVEVRAENDSIDFEIRIQEGPQAIINRVTVTGNTKTNDHVIMREVRTQPGQLFSRNDIIRTQRELANLGYFNPEKLDIQTNPNPTDGTVDIEYVVEEKPSDQLELSGGYGAGQLVGTLGLSFNNFSMRNFFNGSAWRPLPSGDGQKLSLRAQSSGAAFQSYNISFTEPWLGGKNPNSFTVTAFHSVQNPGGRKKSDPLRSDFKSTGLSVGLGQRLKKPDDFFNVYHDLTFQRYMLDNYPSNFIYSTGTSYNFNFTETFSRTSVDQQIYPRRGSLFSLSLAITPPYSLLGKNKEKDYSTMELEERYKWVEYYKWKFNATTYSKLAGNLVLMTRVLMGFQGYYNSEIGPSPFERFWLGGDGLSGFSLDGREIIALRGYENNSLTPLVNGTPVGGSIYNKYTMELRFPVSLNPSATIYTLGFLEAGNDFLNWKDYSPFNMHRSAGCGVRVFLPMFGMLGLDWGWGFDAVKGLPGADGSHFAFTIGQQF